MLAEKVGERVDVSWIGRGMSKTMFIRTIVESKLTDGGIGWIRERVTKSGNIIQVKVAKQYEGKVVCIVGGYHFVYEQGKILKIIDCVETTRRSEIK